MSIEIREVVIKATVHRSGNADAKDFVTKYEMAKIQDRLTDKILKKVKDLISEERSMR